MPTTLFFAPFDLPDVGAVEVGEGGEFFLGQAAFLTEFADSEANILNDVTLRIGDLRLMIGGEGIIGGATDKSTTRLNLLFMIYD
jgi:hypothetical protein